MCIMIQSYTYLYGACYEFWKRLCNVFLYDPTLNMIWNTIDFIVDNIMIFLITTMCISIACIVGLWAIIYTFIMIVLCTLNTCFYAIGKFFLMIHTLINRLIDKSINVSYDITYKLNKYSSELKGKPEDAAVWGQISEILQCEAT